MARSGLRWASMRFSKYTPNSFHTGFFSVLLETSERLLRDATVANVITCCERVVDILLLVVAGLLGLVESSRCCIGNGGDCGSILRFWYNNSEVLGVSGDSSIRCGS